MSEDYQVLALSSKHLAFADCGRQTMSSPHRPFSCSFCRSFVHLWILLVIILFTSSCSRSICLVLTIYSIVDRLISYLQLIFLVLAIYIIHLFILKSHPPIDFNTSSSFMNWKSRHGAKDPLVPEHHPKWFHETIPNSKLHIFPELPGSGEGWMKVENHGEF